MSNDDVRKYRLYLNGLTYEQLKNLYNKEKNNNFEHTELIIDEALDRNMILETCILGDSF